MSRFGTYFSRAFVFGFIGVLSTLSVFSRSNADEHNGFRAYKPLSGFSLSLGSQRMVGYYEDDTGLCKVTFLVSPDMQADELPIYTPVRVIQTVEPGRLAIIDTPEGKSLEFGCRPRAEAMTLRTLNLVAAYKPINVK